MAHLYFSGTTEKNPLTYAVGEEIIFRVRLTENGTDPVPCTSFHCTIRPDGGETVETWESGAAGQLEVRTSCSIPGFVFVTIEACDGNGNRLPDSEPYDGGAGAAIHEIRHAGGEPVDFLAFWERTIREKLDPIPPVFLQKREIPGNDPDNLLFDIRVAAPEPCAASGYLRIPKNAAPASLPIRLQFLGYGIGSARVPDRRDCIDVCINQHGTENGREPAYYEEFAKLPRCQNFAFDPSRNRDPETCDFQAMLLRDLQTLRLLKTMPEWNGRDILCEGGSMGAFQSTFVAAFDPDVTELSISIPWMCDVGGTAMQRTPGWRPDFLPCMAYYDTVNFARHVHCPTHIYAGLGDSVCPPSGVMALYEEIRTEKTLQFTQDADHGRSGPASVTYIV